MVSSSRQSWALVAVAWLAAAGALLAWLSRTPPGVLQEHLKHLQFWSLEACVFLGLALAAAIVPALLRTVDRRDIRSLLILAALAAGLSLLVAPRTNRIYYDEHIYQNIGQNLSDLKLAQKCNDGSVEGGRLQCVSGEYNKQPYAYPHALSLVYRAFGVRPDAAFVVNAAVMAATVCALYLLVFTVFGNREAAFFAGLLLALTPEQIRWTATAAVEPSASLACVLALLAAAHASRAGSALTLAGAAVAAAYAVQFRPESLLILPVAALLMGRRLRDELTSPTFWWVGLLFFGLVAVHVAHLFSIRDAGWGTTDARLSLRYVMDNLRVNGKFYLADPRFPPIATLLALVGLCSRSFGAERASILLYFLLFFGIGLLFYAGSYNYGADVRYSLMTYPPLAMAGGLGAAGAARYLGVHLRQVRARDLVAFALGFQFLWYAPLVRATTDGAWAARSDVRFARSFVSDLPDDSYVLTHNPGMFHVWGTNAGQMSAIVINPRYLDLLAGRYRGGIYLHWNFWCNAQDAVQRDLCDKALGTAAVDMVHEYRERDQRFAFYRFENPAGAR
jgi:hypothetical protein